MRSSTQVLADPADRNLDLCLETGDGRCLDRLLEDRRWPTTRLCDRDAPRYAACVSAVARARNSPRVCRKLEDDHPRSFRECVRGLETSRGCRWLESVDV